MKKFLVGAFVAIIFTGCTSINTVFDSNENDSISKPTKNAAAEKQFEKHDTYKPWWSK